MKLESKIEDRMDNHLENRLESSGWQAAVKSLTMPEKMKEELSGQRGKKEKKGFYSFRYAKLLPAACMALLLATTGITAHAVYINTHLNVFVTHDITSEQLSDLENTLRQMEGVSSCRYISGDEAWEEFKEAYLTPEMAEGYTDNPLADSANLRVGISLKADVEEMREVIGKLEGVRLVSGLWEDSEEK